MRSEDLIMLADRFEKVNKYSLSYTKIFCNEKWRSDIAG
jgi:hypothetical protein